MTLENDPNEGGLYIFDSYSKRTNFDFNTSIFDIKDYLIALGAQNAEIIQKYRLKYGLIEEEYATEWIEALLPYFRTKKSGEEVRLSTQNLKYLEEKADVNGSTYLEESQSNWVGEPLVLVAFLECLRNISDYEAVQNNLNRLFPMICQVLDDFRAKFKIEGVKLLNEFMRIVPAEIFNKFNLHLVLYESLRVNVSFDSDELLELSIDCWMQLIKKVEKFGGKEFLKRADELLLILCRDVGSTSKTNRKIILLKSIGKIVDDLMEYSAIRYLRKITVTLCEVVKDDFTCEGVVDSGRDAMERVIKNCWIRLNCPELQEIIRNTFYNDERINNLLKMVKENAKN